MTSHLGENAHPAFPRRHGALIKLKCPHCKAPVGEHHKPPCPHITPGYSCRVTHYEATSDIER